MATDTTQAIDTIARTVQQTTSRTIQDVSTIADKVSTLITDEQTHARALCDALAAARTHARALRADVCTHTRAQASVEDMYLAQQYDTYSPTGKTPVRQEYRYNRQLASTSPHDRILARLRDSWKQNQQNNCIVIESDESQPCSDSESVESPESECSQVEVVPASDCRNIMKSKSDNDIYQNRQPNGQENRSISSRKPSKLRAPSNKKPLVERNIYQQ